jgi:hypothetical protein
MPHLVNECILDEYKPAVNSIQTLTFSPLTVVTAIKKKAA